MEQQQDKNQKEKISTKQEYMKVRKKKSIGMAKKIFNKMKKTLPYIKINSTL